MRVTLRRLKTWPRVAVAAITLGLVACGGSGPTSSTAEYREPWSEAKTIDEDTIELRYVRGPCDSYVRTDVQEEPTQVVLTIISRGETNRPCNDVGMTEVVTVDLPAPLAGRELVNGACKDQGFGDWPECSQATTTTTGTNT
jgi:hypothetical protein